MDLFSLDACHRLGFNATNTMQEGRQPAPDGRVTSRTTMVSTSLYGPLCVNNTLSIKPEVHNVSQEQD